MVLPLSRNRVSHANASRRLTAEDVTVPPQSWRPPPATGFIERCCRRSVYACRVMLRDESVGSLAALKFRSMPAFSCRFRDGSGL